MERSASAQPNTTKSPPNRAEFDPEAIVDLHHMTVWRYLRALGCEATLAEDLTQDTFLKVIQRPFDDYDDASTAAYLRRVARNLFVSHQRRMGKVIAVDDLQKFEQAWEAEFGSHNGDDFLDALRNCFKRLSERARWALQMRFRDQLARIEIARNWLRYVGRSTGMSDLQEKRVT